MASRELPSGVAGRAVALLLALLTVGLFAGSSVFHETSLGLRWFREASTCVTGSCSDSVNGWLVTFQIFGMLGAVAATATITLLAPRRLIRRRRLRAFGPELGAVTQRVGDLAGAAGCARPPQLYLASVRQRDAVTFGLPGEYRIALPPSLVVRHRQPAVFDPVVRHELAHIRHHDVLIAWSTRPALWVSGVLLVVPVGFALVDGDLSLMPSYLWRAALLLAVTTLVCAGILRSREFEADAAAAPDDSRADELRGVLATLPQRPGRRWRALTALHPTPRDRLRALDDPTSQARVGFLDVATVSFLTSLSVSLVSGLVAERLSWNMAASATGPVLGGLLLGCTLGPALWRAALSAAPRPLPVSLGAFLGYAGGAAASLNEVGTGTIGGADLRTALIDAVLTAGTVSLLLASSSLASGVVSRTGGRAAALASALLGSLTIGLGLWLAHLVSVAWSVDLEALRQTVVSLAGTRHVASLLVLLTVVVLALLLVAAGAQGPRRLLTGTTYCLVAAGAATLVIVAFRARAGAATDAAHAQQRLDAYVWMWALAGVAAGVALALRYGRGGLAASLAATPVTCLLAGGLFCLVNRAYGGDLSWGFVTRVASLSTGLGYVFLAVVALAWSLVPGPGADAAVPLRRAAALLAAVVIPAALGGVALAAREQVSPLSAARAVTQDLGPQGKTRSTSPSPAEVAQYRAYAQLTTRSIDTTLKMGSLLLDPRTPAPSSLIREDLVAPSQQQLEQARSVAFDNPQLAVLQLQLVTGLELQVQGYTEAADAIDSGDVALATRSSADRREALVHLAAWIQGVDALG